VPSRKQRRRREKSRRHEYEYVYVDEEGHEVEVDEDDLPIARKDKDRAKTTGRGGRPVRQVPPPTWGRVGKRVLIFAPLMFVLFSVTNKGVPVASRIVFTLGYTALFVPFLYWIDRLAYRRYLRQTGREPDGPAGRDPRARRR
jgi:hypothetical protein